ncbi:peptidoglycan bridge formation glycyltransferase FemA/FemB family protein [Candidatus Saccharibacteria bacterium]|nr:peptidoglycan bridge formation glycyltransferase FemA/FemB family protein [Candidatus Saccharibacteria bacterium]
MIRIASPDEITNWDSLVVHNTDGGHIYNTVEWGAFKATVGWQPHYFVYESAGYIAYFCLASKQASFLGTIFYCSKGPGFFKDFTSGKESVAHFGEFCNELGPFIARYDRKAILVKLEPEVFDGEVDMHTFGLVKAKSDLQFKATIFVDLSPTEEEILAGFKQKTRYNIRLSERKGIKIERREMTNDNVELMYKLMAATQTRAGFFLRKKDYFAGYWQGLAKAGLGQFLVATHEGDVLAGIYATHFDTKGYYKDGGSFSIKRNLMAPYLLQWEAMRWAKEQGATRYDLVAVPPKAHLEDPNHPQAGLYQFKRGFNEEVTEFTGCWDLPVSKAKYKTWQHGESQFLKLYSKMTKNLFW